MGEDGVGGGDRDGADDKDGERGTTTVEICIEVEEQGEGSVHHSMLDVVWAYVQRSRFWIDETTYRSCRRMTTMFRDIIQPLPQPYCIRSPAQESPPVV